jgi:hypothetical protein
MDMLAHYDNTDINRTQTVKVQSFPWRVPDDSGARTKTQVPGSPFQQSGVERCNHVLPAYLGDRLDLDMRKPLVLTLLDDGRILRGDAVVLDPLELTRV